MVFVPVLVATVLFFVSPFLLPYGAVQGLDGTPLIMDFWDIWSDMGVVPMVSYALGDILCHQECARSIIVNGSQMPVCVRDVFIMVGFAAVGLALTFRGADVSLRWAVSLFLVALSLMFIDHTVQSLFVLNVPFTRAVTGAFLGGSVALAVDAWLRVHEPIVR